MIYHLEDNFKIHYYNIQGNPGSLKWQIYDTIGPSGLTKTENSFRKGMIIPPDFIIV